MILKTFPTLFTWDKFFQAIIRIQGKNTIFADLGVWKIPSMLHFPLQKSLEVAAAIGVMVRNPLQKDT
jgi:hypothetical protein